MSKHYPKTLILHGWGGSDSPHWQAELATEIAKNYGTVSFPLLDNCHFPSKNRWIKQIKELLKTFQPHTVVCHSLANTLWFWLCQEKEMQKIARLIMVSPPSLNTKEETIKTFFPCKTPQNIYAQEVHLIVSDNDPWIQVEEAQKMAQTITASFTVIKDAKHINAESGYGKWDYIENLLLSSQNIQKEYS